jgi:NAD(P)-dependent dehydrogenase (short-subunit alcohol dehydrogenase family)
VRSRCSRPSSETAGMRLRRPALRPVLDQGAAAVVGDLPDLEETRGVAGQVNRLGPMDAVIHNAGVYTGRHILPVNIVAPYLLTALIDRPQRLVRLGHLTQEWLATSEDPDACTSGGYSHHQRRTEPHRSVRDRWFQEHCSRTWLASPPRASFDPVGPRTANQPALLHLDDPRQAEAGPTVFGSDR